MTGYVADHQTGPTVNREHVVPVATHGGVTRGEIHRGHVEGLGLGQHSGQEGILEQLGVGSLLSRCLLALTLVEQRAIQCLCRQIRDEVEGTRLLGAKALGSVPAEARGADDLTVG